MTLKDLIFGHKSPVVPARLDPVAVSDLVKNHLYVGFYSFRNSEPPREIGETKLGFEDNTLARYPRCNDFRGNKIVLSDELANDLLEDISLFVPPTTFTIQNKLPYVSVKTGYRNHPKEIGFLPKNCPPEYALLRQSWGDKSSRRLGGLRHGEFQDLYIGEFLRFLTTGIGLKVK